MMESRGYWKKLAMEDVGEKRLQEASCGR